MSAIQLSNDDYPSATLLQFGLVRFKFAATKPWFYPITWFLSCGRFMILRLIFPVLE
jgi:hypothetical protein